MNNLHHIIGRDPRPMILLAINLSIIGSLIALWEILVRTGVLPAHSFPTPTMITQQIWKLATEGEYLVGMGQLYLHDHALASAWRVVPGLVVGTMLGYLTALILIVHPALRYFSIFVVACTYGLSSAALYVILQAWFGVGELPKILTSAWIGFGSQLIIVYWRAYLLVYKKNEAERTEWQGIFDHLQLLGVSPWRTVSDHFIPLFQVEMFVAFMAASVYAMKVLVFTEMNGMARGLGYLVILGRVRSEDTTLIFAGAVLLVLSTLLLWALIWGLRYLVLRSR